MLNQGGPTWNLIQAGRITDMFRRLLGVQGGGVTTLSPELFPTWDIVAREADELAALLGVKWFTATGSSPAGGAGAYSRAGIQNSSGSGVLAVIRRITVYNGDIATGTIGIYRQTNNTPVAPSVAIHYSDWRLADVMPPLSWAVGSALLAPPASLQDSWFVGAGGSASWNGFWLLPPGTALEVLHQTTNVSLGVSVQGYVRAASATELQI